jgi:hypothetical protein
LTNAAVKLLETSGAKKCVDENLIFFNKEIHKLSPKVALDVENYALSVLNKNTDNSFFNPIKDFVYNVPYPYTIIDDDGNSLQIKDAINLGIILLIMSIYLRDKYFEYYPQYYESGYIKS